MLIVAAVPVLMAQTQPELPPDINSGSGLEVLLQWYDGVYIALVWILGFFHNLLPFDVKDKWVRVLAFGIIAGLFVFVAFSERTWADILSLLFSFAMATGVIYPLGKKIGLKSPKVEPKVA